MCFLIWILEFFKPILQANSLEEMSADGISSAAY